MPSFLGRLRPLAKGVPAPGFDLPDERGRRHRLSDYAGRWLALFFYPRDHTPECVREACAFNELWPEFRDAGAEILGCSGEDAASHQAMSAACRLRYPLLTDPEGEMRTAWGAFGPVARVPRRLTYLVDPGGTIRYAHTRLFRGADHAGLALAALRRLVPSAQGGLLGS